MHMTRRRQSGVRSGVQRKFTTARNLAQTRSLITLVAAAVVSATGLAAQASTAPSRPVEGDDPFARRSWHVELGAHQAVEAWNFNVSHEEMYGLAMGLTYGLRDGLALTARSPFYFVDQPRVNAFLLGATIGVRSRILRRPKGSLFLEFELGVSEADTLVPPRGTRFNYLVLGGAGISVRLRPGRHLLAGVRWIHVSNGGFAGRDRNPDIEAVGLQTGLLLAF